MADKMIEKDMPLKTTLMGFDKKAVMDFIEEIQKENQKLKHIVVSLGTENDQLKAQIGELYNENTELKKLISYSSEMPEEDAFIDISSSGAQPTAVEEQPAVTYEDISLSHYENSIAAETTVVKETVQPAVAITKKKPGVTVIRSTKKKTR